MEFDVRTDPRTKVDSLVIKNKINLYKEVPFGSLTLEESEDLFRQRIEALTIIEEVDLYKDLTLANSFREIKSYVYKTNCIISKTGDEQQRKLDQYSHMLVRMYCIYQPNLWDWFKKCERKLLNYRLKDHMASLSGKQLEAILRSYKFDFERISNTEINHLKKEGLVGWSSKTRDAYDRENLDIFKVKFTDALKFISRRSVSLKAGFAFLTRHEIISVVCDAFERHLDNELKYARQHLNVSLFQTQQLLECLHAVYLEHQEKSEEERRRKKRNEDGISRNPYTIDINDLESTVKLHYPPCMRYMHDSLVKDNHLKHQGRLYYGAFLRTGGVDMDSAIEFWRREFTKKIANDKFDRDYKYNIRHLYGREGHKKALSCFSCDKIINDNAPGPSEKHGCPFKHFDDTHLKGMLMDHGLKSVDIESILTVRNNREYKTACSDYFKYSKGNPPSEAIKNPIHFYYESQRLANRPPEEPKREPLLEGEEDMDDQDFITDLPKVDN